MPFTLSHSAAVLPIHSRWRQWLSLAPLVVGSMVPDAEYYLPVPQHFKENAHTWLGALSSSVPVGVALLLIFYLVAPEVTLLLPSPHREALRSRAGTPALSVRAALLAACGIVIGAETHVTWDSFTHRTGWMVQHISFLREPIGPTHLYFVLQFLSSAVGLYILAYVYDQWAKTEGFRAWTLREFSWRSFFWAGVLVGSLVPAMIESHTVRMVANFPLPGTRHFAVILMTSFIRNVVLAVCAVALCMKLFGCRSRLDAAYSSES